MMLKKFHQIVNNTPDYIKEDVQLSMDILERIHELLDSKFGGKQKLLAEKLGKSEAEVSKWLSGVQNYTTRTLVKLQIAFGEPIIAVCTNKENATFVQVKNSSQITHTKIFIDKTGHLEETKETFVDVRNSNIKANIKANLLL